MQTCRERVKYHVIYQTVLTARGCRVPHQEISWDSTRSLAAMSERNQSVYLITVEPPITRATLGDTP